MNDLIAVYRARLDALEQLAMTVQVFALTNTAIVGAHYLVMRLDFEQLGEALHRYYKAQRTHAQPRLFKKSEVA